MTGRSMVVAAALVALAAVSMRGQGQPSVSGAWVVEPAAGATATSAYAVIENPSMYEVYVIGVATDAAGEVDIADGGADAARAVKELPVPAYGQTELKPDGVHIRLKDLKRPLKSGETVEMTLTLDSGAAIKVSAPVKKG